MISAGIRAAVMLEEACRSTPGAANSPQLAIVRDLALDLGQQLETLFALARQDAAPDVLAEAAICCADLANLAACNAPDLPPDDAPRAAEATRLAADAVYATTPLVENMSKDLDAEHASNLLRDVRSAGWRAQFAVRLVEGRTGAPSPD